MNQKNNEGFTALLYASYSGYIDIIKYLIEEYGVNYELTTNTGLNPLHLAAQKNNILPFLYFKNKIDLNIVDD
jgi:ankyrin repeat protein